MTVRPVTVLVGLALLAGCMGGERRAQRDDQRHGRECTSPRGSVTDLRDMPEWAGQARRNGWTTTAGCMVRLDVIAQRQGPQHCQWEVATVLSTGVPLGRRWSHVEETATYVRDPTNVFGDVATARGFIADGTLPADAVDTTYRRLGLALWMVPGDSSAVYIVGDRVERWPRDPDPSLCA